MNIAEIILILVAVGLVAADIAVRLIIAPRNRDRWVGELLDVLHEPQPDVEAAPAIAPKLLPSESLGESLLRHFTQSSLSCRIVEILAANGSGMHEAEIAAAANAQLAEKNRRPMPEAAVRKVVMILMGADFVSLRHGQLSLTHLGRQLHQVLVERQRAADGPVLVGS